MSQNLYWYRWPKKGHAIPTMLAEILGKVFGDPINVILDYDRLEDVRLLAGLAAAGIDGALILYESLEEHKQIQIVLQDS